MLFMHLRLNQRCILGVLFKHHREQVMLHGVSTMMIVGYGLLATGLIIILFSPYRRWLGFMLAGMLFWGFLEGCRAASQAVFNLNDFQGYMSGVAATIILLAVGFSLSDRRRPVQVVPTIEHTPVYDDEIASATAE